MNWPAFLQAAQVRAVEESDAEGSIWDPEVRRGATREAGQGGADADSLLARRAARLAEKGRFQSLEPQLRLHTLPPWSVGLGWVAAFFCGWWLAAVGQESEINLLALPLIAILAWNAVVIIVSLLPRLNRPPERETGWHENLLKRLDRPAKVVSPPDTLISAAATRFLDLARGPALQRFACRFRAWLHVGAALLALGSISAMYARGWSKEYRAVWESTLLHEQGATKFFRALFAPASLATGQKIPLDQLPGMRRRPEQPAPAPGDALPWIHLYAATLGLFVLVPRILLVLLESSRARSIPRRVIGGPAWQAYAQRLRSQVEGSGAPALVLTHGLAQDAASKDRWRHWAYLHWRDLGALAFDTVPQGGEQEFVNGWMPATSRVMVVFNMAATPEAEVQRALVEGLARKLKSTRDSATVLLALDDAALRQRWSGFADLPARLAERACAWNEALNGTGAVWHEMVMPSHPSTR